MIRSIITIAVASSTSTGAADFYSEPAKECPSAEAYA